MTPKEMDDARERIIESLSLLILKGSVWIVIMSSMGIFVVAGAATYFSSMPLIVAIIIRFIIVGIFGLLGLLLLCTYPSSNEEWLDR